MRSDKTIWILEDDPGCIFVYEQMLDIRYPTRYFSTVLEFKRALQDRKHEVPSLVIADLRLPDDTFLNFLGKLENKNLLTCPFLVVSSLDDLDALRFCYEEGATDYLIKPFKQTELVVKIEQLLLKAQTIGEQFNEEFYAKESLGPKFGDLTLKESSILSLFMKSPNNKVRREQIMGTVWDGITVQNKTVDVHLHNLRKKISVHGMNIKSIGPGEWLFVEKDSSLLNTSGKVLTVSAGLEEHAY